MSDPDLMAVPYDVLRSELGREWEHEAGFVILADAEGLGTISDNDPWPVLSINDLSVTEGQGGVVAALFSLSLSAPSGRTLSVAFATANGTAIAGNDYIAASGTVTFPPGTTTQTVSIVVTGDSSDEVDETFFVDLSNPLLVTLGNNRGTCTILNDDPAPGLSINDVAVTEGNAGSAPATFTLRLAVASGKTATVDFASANGTAVAGADYTATNG